MSTACAIHPIPADKKTQSQPQRSARFFSRRNTGPDRALRDEETQMWRMFQPSKEMQELFSSPEQVVEVCRQLASGSLPQKTASALVYSAQAIVESHPEEENRLIVMKGIYTAAYAHRIDVSPMLPAMDAGIRSVWPEVRAEAARAFWGLTFCRGSAKPFMRDLIIALRDENPKVVEYAVQALSMTISRLKDPVDISVKRQVHEALGEFIEILAEGSAQEHTLMLIASALKHAQEHGLLPKSLLLRMHSECKDSPHAQAILAEAV